MKLIDYLTRASARLDEAGVSFGHGTTNSHDEAAWLVLWRLGLPLDDLDSVADRALKKSEVATLDALIAQRIETRKPAAYLTGEAWLQGVPFTVDERVIVPRSLIAEVLAEGVIDAWMPVEIHRVLDLCTGNGSLAVLAAMAWPDVAVDAADLSPDALAVAKVNVERHELARRITLLQGNGLAAVRRDRRYDVILCNPPYVNAASMAALPAEFRAEPEMALAGGADGMDFIRTLLAGAVAHMTPDAVLVLEIGNEREHFDAAFPELDVVWLPTQLTDDAVLLVTRAMLAAGLPKSPT
ncbi:50S ribosomal protein L3 N(5)-glutamine methyltransferase [Scleromatobacter humisilvae]|uniref:50S ribosomal protein L3 N(5)-glutamine methyltransferase n=1 Tax=Scleromatobacter humisilvae TaxID=2897159 RepID=A0A9X1YJ39_9BURK|nr:50S ribosomal protein L3 N(5)-glutamine methyltransferase [Scleromatobacter humisilvae]MCK9686861.1 50S ribosomal protein L3 N(5)-glutamine methyltransferase [Scleromatobacter humisilvae]